MTFVFWSHENGELEVAGGSGHREIVRRDHTSSAAERGEQLGPTLSDCGIEIDDSGQFDERIDSCAAMGGAFLVPRESNADEQLPVDDSRDRYWLARVRTKRVTPFCARPIERNECACVDY